MTRFSVVVTNWDYRDFVAEAVDSALAQSRPPERVGYVSLSLRSRAPWWNRVEGALDVPVAWARGRRPPTR